MPSVVTELHTNAEGVTRRDGKIIDTIPSYVWTRFLGGNFDGQEIVGRDLEKPVVKFGEEPGLVYSRRVQVTGPLRIVAYVAVDHPRDRFWPYEVMREVAKSHPALKLTTFQKAKQKEKD